MAKELSKYAAKKARQAETGEVGYLTAEISGKVEVAVKTKGPTRQTADERKAQSERDKERNAAKIRQDHNAVALHIRGFIGRMEDAANALNDCAVMLALAAGNSHGQVKGDVSAVKGIYGVANEKAQSALLRARMLLAVLEGAKK